jgi:microcystin-dependent protein
MTRGKWLTPNTPSSGYACFTLRIPNSEEFKAIVNGALLPLLSPYNFEEEGDLSPLDTAELFQQMYDDWLNGRNCMIGSIFAYASLNPPNNCLVCDGAHYLKSDYPLLAAVIDPVFNVDSTHFAVPDMRQKMLMGAKDATAGYAPGNTGGEATHVLTAAEMPSHTHTYLLIAGAPLAAGPGPLFTNVSQTPSPTSSAGSDGAHNNIPPYLALKFAIVAK